MAQKKDFYLIFKSYALLLFQIRDKSRLIFLNLKWARANQHNSTSIKKTTDIELISVGKGTYGALEVHSYDNKNEKLIIGNYVSIAREVKFILGGNHQMNTLTTFPFYSYLFSTNPDLDATTKGPIIICDEVWIGVGVIILSGVTIGKGAIVAAGSVVTKNVPEYTLVGGNPSKVIRTRFDDTIIQRLKNLNLSSLSEYQIKENISLLYDDINNSIDKINTLIKG